MIQWKKGFGVGQSIILLGFLVFLLIPMFTFMTEKVYLKYVTHILSEATDLAAMTAIQAIDVDALSSGEVGIIMSPELRRNIMDIISDNSPGSVEILDYEINSHKSGEICSMGNTSDSEFLHILLSVSVKRMHNEESIQFYIHRDVEIPRIRME